MDFDRYQEEIKKYDTFTPVKNVKEPAFTEKIMGLAGESGEVVEKFKKVIRDRDGVLTEQDREEINKELGDVVWYIASLARYLDIPFSEVIRVNLEKSADRLKRNKIHGSGDNR